MNRNLGLSVLAFGLILAGSRAARADVPPPNSTECAQLQPGDPCMTDDSQDGTCTASTCSKLDYSNGTPPTTVEYACVLCVPGTAASGGGSAVTTTTSSGGGCAVTGTPPDGAWWVAAALALPLLRRRRSRSR